MVQKIKIYNTFTVHYSGPEEERGRETPPFSSSSPCFPPLLDKWREKLMGEKVEEGREPERNMAAFIYVTFISSLPVASSFILALVEGAEEGREGGKVEGCGGKVEKYGLVEGKGR